MVIRLSSSVCCLRKEDGEDQVEVEREEGEVKEKRSWMIVQMK